MLKMLSKKNIEICMQSIRLYRTTNFCIDYISKEDRKKNSLMVNKISMFLVKLIEDKNDVKLEDLIVMIMDKEFMDTLYCAILLNLSAVIAIRGVSKDDFKNIDDLEKIFKKLLEDVYMDGED